MKPWKVYFTEALGGPKMLQAHMQAEIIYIRIDNEEGEKSSSEVLL